jgi:hypothetical protein
MTILPDRTISNKASYQTQVFPGQATVKFRIQGFRIFKMHRLLLQHNTRLFRSNSVPTYSKSVIRHMSAQRTWLLFVTYNLRTGPLALKRR